MYRRGRIYTLSQYLTLVIGSPIVPPLLLGKIYIFVYVYSLSGTPCASTNHTHHRDLHDSIDQQWRRNMDFYHALVGEGLYINAPDPYFFDGTHKCGLGYDESQWSMERWQWITQARQEIYDQTFHKVPSMGWMFVPIDEYHAGGDVATIEPIKEHMAEYNFILGTYFLSGIQAAYRGRRLFDPTDGGASEKMVAGWVTFFKAHRVILNSDIIHVRRADLGSYGTLHGGGYTGRVDVMMHVNPDRQACPERALAVIYNQAATPARDRVVLPLYYSGIAAVTGVAVVTDSATGKVTRHAVSAFGTITVEVDVPAMSITWMNVTEG